MVPAIGESTTTPSRRPTRWVGNSRSSTKHHPNKDSFTATAGGGCGSYDTCTAAGTFSHDDTTAVSSVGGGIGIGIGVTQDLVRRNCIHSYDNTLMEEMPDTAMPTLPKPAKISIGRSTSSGVHTALSSSIATNDKYGSSAGHANGKNSSSNRQQQQQHQQTQTQTQKQPKLPIFIDDGLHHAEDFENMIIECYNSDSSFGDITYDESIVDDEYYRNRHASAQQQQQQRRSSSAGNNNKNTTLTTATTTSAAVTGASRARCTSLELRSPVGRSKNHPTRFVRPTTATAQQQPPVGGSCLTPTSMRLDPNLSSTSSSPAAKVTTTTSSINGGGGGGGSVCDFLDSHSMSLLSHNDDIDEQEQALIELAMERSLIDCGSVPGCGSVAGFSMASRGTYNSRGGGGGGGSVTSRDSHSALLAGAGCHLAMMASNSQYHNPHHQLHGNTNNNNNNNDNNNNGNVPRFLWKREGKKWLKVPVGPGADNEGNLHAIAEEFIQEPYAPLPVGGGTHQIDCTDFKHLRSPPKHHTNQIAHLPPEEIDRLEQVMIDEALHRSVDCLHQSCSSSITSFSVQRTPGRNTFNNSPNTNTTSMNSSFGSSSMVYQPSAGGYNNHHRDGGGGGGGGGSILSFKPDTTVGATVVDSLSDEEQRMLELAVERSLHEHSMNSLSSNASLDSCSRSEASRVQQSSVTSQVSGNSSNCTNNNNNNNNNNNSHRQSTTRPPIPRPPGRSPAVRKEDALSYVGSRLPSTRKILTGIDYEEDEEELMAEHLPNTHHNHNHHHNHHNQQQQQQQQQLHRSRPTRRQSLQSVNSTSSLMSRGGGGGGSCCGDSTRRTGDFAGQTESGMKLIWKRGPNNTWGKFPEIDDEEEMVRQAMELSMRVL